MVIVLKLLTVSERAVPMSITIQLPSDIEATLRAEANAQGRDASDLVLDLITERFAVAANLPPLGPVHSYPSRDAYIVAAVSRADEFNVDPEIASGIASGIADSEQGQSYTLDEVRDNIRAALATAKRST